MQQLALQISADVMQPQDFDLIAAHAIDGNVVLVQHPFAGDWAQGEIDSCAALIPAWLRTAVQQVNAPCKSAKIGLSGAYDWSNSNIRDDALILKVLERHKFGDVARLCFYYGVPKVKRLFKRLAFEPMTNALVTRVLSNTSKGLRAKP